MEEQRNIWPRRISRISVAVIYLLCGLVLTGWVTHNLNLLELLPRFPAMMAWTAVCYLSLATALSLKLFRPSSEKVKKYLKTLIWVFTLAPVLVALASFCEDCFPINTHIDSLLFSDFLNDLPRKTSGHMYFQVSLSILFFGIGFLLLQSSNPRRVRAGQFLILIAGASGLVVVVAHMYGVGARMSLPSSACAVYMAAGMLAVRTDVGITTFFVEQGGGSILVRQLLWASLVVPLGVSLFISWAENLHILDPSIGSLLYTIITVGGFALLISYVAKKINDAERERVNFVSEQTARRQAEEAVRERDEFLSICSHELKTPLTSMQLQYQLAQYKIQNGDTKVFEPENVKKQVENTNRQIRRLGRLIEDMLDVSRVTSGKLYLDFKKINLSSLIQEVVDDLKSQFDAARTIVEVAADPDVIIECDRHWIGQVTTNLLTNAGLKYGAGKPVKIIVKKEKGVAVLSVEDQGIGINPADLQRIFKRFERGVSAETFSGLGLGLYITHKIIEGHRGKIDVKSESGKGSLFTVTLPLMSKVS